MKDADLLLDESYDFKTEDANSYWGKIYGSKLPAHNIYAKEKLKIYAELYKEYRKALIVRIK